MGFACTTPSSSSAWSFSLSSSSSISSKRILFPPNHEKWRFLKVVASSLNSNASSSSPMPPQENFDASDPVKSKAEDVAKAERPVDSGGGEGVTASKKSDPVRTAMERAREYKKNKGVVGSGTGARTSTGTQKTTMDNSSNLGDGSIRDMAVKEEKLKISRMDFVGINFSDKKNGRRRPAGLSQVVESLPEGVLPKVEFIVGDAGKLKEKKSAKTNSDKDTDDSEIYKPKVSTWGVFPRPENISKTFGGGRTIHPGEQLETPEEKAASEARIRESVAKYESRIGLNIDAKIKKKCEKALREGDHLMDLGRLQKALPYYEEVMNSVVFRTELHGLAALQWSICQDSLRRHEEARDMYDKLRSHPNAHVSRTARHFVFGFEAMEMLKVSSVSSSSTTGYENYFDAFLEEKPNYSPVEDGQKEEDTLKQVLPYIFFLLSPVFILLVIIGRKAI